MLRTLAARGTVVVLFVTGLAHCSAEVDDRWTAADGLPSSSKVAQPSSMGTFEGSFEAASRRLDIVYHWPSGDVHAEAILPYGTKPDQAYFHTVSAQWAGTCGANTYCAQVTAVNGFAAPVLNFTAVFDTFTIPTVSAVGAPYVYGTVAAKGSSAEITWSFNDPTGANFRFQGHAEGTLASAAGAVGVNPWVLDLGTMPIDSIGANSATNASLAITVQNASTASTSGVVSIARTGATEIVNADTSCNGTTLAALGTCLDTYRLDCRSANGATVGSKTATVTVTDVASGLVTTARVSGTCMATIPECESYLAVHSDCLASTGLTGTDLTDAVTSERDSLYGEAAKGATQSEATRQRCITQSQSDQSDSPPIRWTD